MGIRKFTVSVTTDGSGNATGYTPYFSGKIEQVRYVKTDFTDGVDFTTTLDGTGQTVWTESNVNAAVTKAVRMPIAGTDGVASLFASAGTAVQDKIAVSRDRVKWVVGSGGAAHTGALEVIVSDN
jgi:hypothetical protein